MTHRPEPQSGAAASDGLTARGGVRERRAYRRPSLIEYGPLAKLTQGTPSGSGEFTPQGEKMRMCL